MGQKRSHLNQSHSFYLNKLQDSQISESVEQTLGPCVRQNITPQRQLVIHQRQCADSVEVIKSPSDLQKQQWVSLTILQWSLQWLKFVKPLGMMSSAMVIGPDTSTTVSRKKDGESTATIWFPACIGWEKQSDDQMLLYICVMYQLMQGQIISQIVIRL